MAALKQVCISCSRDDFGAGYPWPDYLCKLPLVQLKIHRSFMRHALTDRNGASIYARPSRLAAASDCRSLPKAGMSCSASFCRGPCFAYPGVLYQHAIPDEHFTRCARELH
jgi:hypothetical protein